MPSVKASEKPEKKDEKNQGSIGRPTRWCAARKGGKATGEGKREDARSGREHDAEMIISLFLKPN